jgi:hypothetical protein
MMRKVTVTFFLIVLLNITAFTTYWILSMVSLVNLVS